MRPLTAVVAGGGLAGYVVFQQLYLRATGSLPSDGMAVLLAVVVGCAAGVVLRRGR